MNTVEEVDILDPHIAFTPTIFCLSIAHLNSHSPSGDLRGNGIRKEGAEHEELERNPGLLEEDDNKTPKLK